MPVIIVFRFSKIRPICVNIPGLVAYITNRLLNLIEKFQVIRVGEKEKRFKWLSKIILNVRALNRDIDQTKSISSDRYLRLVSIMLKSKEKLFDDV